MLERTAIGREIRTYFIERHKKLQLIENGNKQLALPQNYEQALEAEVPNGTTKKIVSSESAKNQKVRYILIGEGQDSVAYSESFIIRNMSFSSKRIIHNEGNWVGDNTRLPFLFLE